MNVSEKQAARTGALPVLIALDETPGMVGGGGTPGAATAPTLTKLKRSLQVLAAIMYLGSRHT